MTTGLWGVDADPTAQGRIQGARPIAVLDIGSNSVRLVVYERHARALTPLYNEKSPAALGRGVAASGRIAEANAHRALTAIRRFALVVELMQVGTTHVLATSAVREAANGPDFASQVEDIMQVPVRVLTGAEEAHFAALGVVAGMPDFSGVVGDLGGGSLELSAIASGRDAVGETHELGAIRLQDDSGNNSAKALVIARERVAKSQLLQDHPGDIFAAIGGTWRALAKLHQVRSKYPLHMVQHYSVAADDILKLCDMIVESAASGKQLSGMRSVSSGRRDLLAYGSAVLAEVLRAGKFKTVIFSALGVREGYLFQSLDEEERNADPLLQGAEEMSLLRSRSPAHAIDLISFTDKFFSVTELTEEAGDVRLRQAACYLSDIGWRGHPDYRGEQSIDLVAYGSLTGLDHPDRAFLCEVLAVRYMGLKHKSVSSALLELAGEKANTRARVIGALFRVAYPMSAAMPGVLPRARFFVDGKKLGLQLPSDLAFLDGERLQNRLVQLADVAGFKGAVIRVS